MCECEYTMCVQFVLFIFCNNVVVVVRRLDAACPVDSQSVLLVVLLDNLPRSDGSSCTTLSCSSPLPRSPVLQFSVLQVRSGCLLQWKGNYLRLLDVDIDCSLVKFAVVCIVMATNSAAEGVSCTEGVSSGDAFVAEGCRSLIDVADARLTIVAVANTVMSTSTLIVLVIADCWLCGCWTSIVTVSLTLIVVSIVIGQCGSVLMMMPKVAAVRHEPSLVGRSSLIHRRMVIDWWRGMMYDRWLFVHLMAIVVPSSPPLVLASDLVVPPLQSMIWMTLLMLLDVLLSRWLKSLSLGSY